MIFFQEIKFFLNFVLRTILRKNNILKNKFWKTKLYFCPKLESKKKIAVNKKCIFMNVS